MNTTDKQRIDHIWGYCRDISDFIERFGENYNVFMNDKAYYNSVAMCILQIGKLANGLSEEFREETKNQMPWTKIRGMRNLVAHAYFQLDSSILWDTANNDIRNLESFCEKILKQDLEKPSVIARLQQIWSEEKAVGKKPHKKNMER